MRTIRELIQEHPFFKELPEDKIELISGCGQNVHFRKGETVFREGETADSFFLVRKGMISLEIDGAERGPISVQTVEDDDILGWSWLIPPHYWKFTGIAIKETSVISLDGKCLREKCQKDHDLGYELLLRFAGVLYKRLEATRLQLLDLYGVH